MIKNGSSKQSGTQKNTKTNSKPVNNNNSLKTSSSTLKNSTKTNNNGALKNSSSSNTLAKSVNKNKNSTNANANNLKNSTNNKNPVRPASKDPSKKQALSPPNTKKTTTKNAPPNKNQKQNNKTSVSTKKNNTTNNNKNKTIKKTDNKNSKTNNKKTDNKLNDKNKKNETKSENPPAEMETKDKNEIPNTQEQNTNKGINISNSNDFLVRGPFYILENKNQGSGGISGINNVTDNKNINIGDNNNINKNTNEGNNNNNDINTNLLLSKVATNKISEKCSHCGQNISSENTLKNLKSLSQNNNNENKNNINDLQNNIPSSDMGYLSYGRILNSIEEKLDNIRISRNLYNSFLENKNKNIINNKRYFARSNSDFHKGKNNYNNDPHVKIQNIYIDLVNNINSFSKKDLFDYNNMVTTSRNPVSFRRSVIDRINSPLRNDYFSQRREKLINIFK